MKQIRKRKQSTKTSSGPIGTIFPLSLDVQRTKGITRWGGRGRGLPCPFSEIGKKFPDWRHLWVKFLI